LEKGLYDFEVQLREIKGDAEYTTAYFKNGFVHPIIECDMDLVGEIGMDLVGEIG
jgi:hypothetical protein